jgi:HEAT repeat protein
MLKELEARWYLARLRSNQSAIQEHAAEVLSRLGDRRSVPLLIGMLGAFLSHTRETAIAALARLGVTAADRAEMERLVLLATLCREDRACFSDAEAAALAERVGARWGVRISLREVAAVSLETIVDSLGVSGDQQAIPPLLRLLRSHLKRRESHPFHRLPKATLEIVLRAGDASFSGELWETGREYVSPEDLEIIEHVITALGRLHAGDAVELLLKLVHVEGYKRPVNVALHEIGVWRAIEYRDLRAEVGDPEAIGVIVGWMNGDYYDHLLATENQLRRLGATPEQLAPGYRKCLVGTSDHRAFRHAAAALARMRDHATAPILVDNMYRFTHEGGAAPMYVQALAEIGSDFAINAVIGYQIHESAAIREAAIASLAWRGVSGERQAQVLRTIVDRRLRYTGWLDSDYAPDCGEGRHGESGFRELLAALEALDRLGATPEPDPVFLLLREITSAQVDYAFRMLGDIRGPARRAVPGLQRIAEEGPDEVRRRARDKLAWMARPS